MPEIRDTIAAIATPLGRGGIGVLRVSGLAARSIGRALCGTLPPPRQAGLRKFRDAAGEPLDQGLALLFPGPHSYTGEDVLELHGHGGPVVLDLVLQRVLALGARLARPGEFSERAFLNDKLDLAQAEAVADLIDSGSAQAARAALRSLRGEFSARVHALTEALTGLRVYVEAALDFPDEELDFLSDGKVAERLAGLRAEFTGLTAAAAQGSLLREGLTVVIAGRPNAGKSSLLNRLAGHDAAIVTEIPGTTRDVLRERISLDGLPLHIVDTAGLRDSTDRVEQEGVRRAWREIGRADQVLLVMDDTYGLGVDEEAILARLPAGQALTLIFNKCDLSGHAPGQEDNRLWLSAKTGAGIELLIEHFKRAAGFETPAEDSFIARRRHLDALERARVHLRVAEQRLSERAAELLAEELRLSQQALGEITGEVTSEDLLGRIFSSFCIGK